MQVRVLIVSVLASFLLSCGQANQEQTGSSTSTSSKSNSTGVGNLDIIPSPIKLPEPSVTPIESRITVAEAAQLTSSQVQELVLLVQEAKQKQSGREFRVIAPTYIPSGFQVDSIEMDARVEKIGRPSYSINYRNSSNEVCFSVDGSSGGWGSGAFEHHEIKVFSNALGIVTLAVGVQDRASNSSFISLRDTPIIRNERGFSFGSGGGGGCRKSLEPQDAVKVVESLQYIDSSQTKARSLEEIRRDAEQLTAKFDFPLDSCGDKPSGSEDRWYPVFIDGTWLADIQHQYCKNAISKEKSQYRFEKVQLGSFTSYERASEFAKAVGGRVGKPDN